MNLIIAGSRTFDNYDLLKRSVSQFICKHNANNDPVTIISGTAKGADSLGELYTTDYGYELQRFPANWDLYGKGAGYIRNTEMAKVATHCIVFWDGQSRGTQHMINIASKYGLELEIVKYEKTS